MGNLKDNTYANYLNDLVTILVEKLEKARKEYANSKGDDKVFLSGQIMAYYDDLDIIKSQAELFEITISSLEGVILEKYLVGR